MQKIRTIIVDDEESSLYLLKEELHPFQEIEIIAEYRDGSEGFQGINVKKPDLVFVDIEMPEMNGFQMLQHLTHEPVIIFCTGHKHYALEAWDYHAADFVTKPIEKDRIHKALEKALDDITNKRQEGRLREQKIFAGLIELTWPDKMDKKSRFFSPEEITHIQADRDYLKIYIIPSLARELGLIENFISIKKTIKEAAKEWENRGFEQIHKSYLINFTKILEWNKSAKKVQLIEVQEPIPIGRSYLKRFQEKWNTQES